MLTLCWWCQSKWLLRQFVRRVLFRLVLFLLVLPRYTRDQRLPSVSQACRQTVSTGSESALAVSRRTLLDPKNCMDLTAPLQCSHLRSRSWSRSVPPCPRSWQTAGRRCTRSASSPSFFSAASQWSPFYLLSSFSTL